MRHLSRLAALLALPAWLFACGSEPSAVPSDAARAIDAAAKAQCTNVDVATAIDEIFPPPGLLNQARTKCGNILRQASRGEIDDAVDEIFAFLDQTLDLSAAGQLSSPSTGTREDTIVALFDALFLAVGVEGPPLTAEALEGGDVVVGNVDESGGTLTVPSAHAAIQFAPGDVADDTWVTITLLPDADPQNPGNCPFAFPTNHDCFPLFYDYTLVPESNLTGSPTIGQCVLDLPDVNAPSATVLPRVRLASESHVNPGTLVFWPLAQAPATVNCTDLAYGPSDWRDSFWAALGPFQRLFEVTPLYANPGKLGASASAFSPFAPADTVPQQTALAAPTALSPAANATIAQNDPATGPHGCTFSNGTWGWLQAFDWSDVAGAASYDIEMWFPNAANPVIQENVATSDHLEVECTGFVVDANLTGWTWFVRARDANNQAGPWSPARSIEFSSVVVSQTATISGTVVDGTNAPVPGAQVTIVNTQLATVTNANGQFQFTGVPVACCTPNAGGGTSDYTLNASAGSLSGSEGVTVTTGVPNVGVTIEIQ